MPRSSPYTIILAEDEAKELEAITRKYTSPYCDVLRAKVVVLAAKGLSNKDIGTRLDIPRQIVSNVISSDEKTSIQARHRLAPTLPPGPGRLGQVEFEYKRCGALAYMAAWDVHRAKILDGANRRPALIRSIASSTTS